MSACLKDVAAGDGFSLRRRAMRPADLGQVLTIENRVYDFPWSRNIFLSCLGGGYENRVVKTRHRVIGYAMMMIAADECHLVNLCVDVPFQRHGIGRSLLKSMLAEAAEMGAKRAVLEVRPSNEVARMLYDSEHFNEMSLRKEYYPAPYGREDALVMMRRL